MQQPSPASLKKRALAPKADLFLTIVFAFGIIACGAWILDWGYRTFQRVDASQGWKREIATIVSSDLVQEGRYKKAKVSFKYVAEGAAHVSKRVGFDTFDNTGGVGTVREIVARYPPGSKAYAYVDPENPDFAVLEPGDFSPFVMPCIFGVLFILFGFFLIARAPIWGAIPSGGTPRPDSQAKTVGVFMSVLLFLVIPGAMMSDSLIIHRVEQCFNPPPDFSPRQLTLLLALLLYLPAPWFFLHLSTLILAAQKQGVVGKLGLVLWILGSSGKNPELNRSRRIVIGSVFYLILMGFLGSMLEKCAGPIHIQRDVPPSEAAPVDTPPSS